MLCRDFPIASKGLECSCIAMPWQVTRKPVAKLTVLALTAFLLALATSTWLLLLSGVWICLLGAYHCCKGNNYKHHGRDGRCMRSMCGIRILTFINSFTFACIY